MHRTHSSLASIWSLFPIKNSVSLFRRPQITKQMLIPAASFWLLLWKPKLVICILDHNPYCQLDHPSHAEALIPAYYSAFWDHLFVLTVRSDGSFWWRVWKTTSRLPDAASKCDASFIPMWKDMNSRSVAVCMRRVSWERAITGMAFQFYQTFTTEWHVFWSFLQRWSR